MEWHFDQKKTLYNQNAVVVLLFTILAFSIFSATAYGLNGKRDNVAPQISVSHNHHDPQINQDVTFTADASDDIAIKTVQIFVDDSIKKTCMASPCKYKTTYPKAGDHTYYAKAFDTSYNRAKDPAGNGAAHKFTVFSTDPPTVSITHSPADALVNEDVTFTADATDDYGVTEINIYTATGNVAPAKTCTFSPVQKQATCDYTTQYAKPGLYFYRANTKDESKSAVEDSKSFRVTDVNVPTGVSVSHTPDKPRDGDLVTFNAAASDDIGVKEIGIYVDGNRRRTCSFSPVVKDGATCAYSTSTLSPKVHSYYATAEDAAGNVMQDPENGTKSVEVLDITAPTITSVTSDKPVYGKVGGTPRITAKATDNVKVTKIEVYVDDELVQTCNDPSFGRCEARVSGGSHTTEGTHNFHAKAFDAKDNSATSETQSYIVDLTAPEVSVSVTDPAEYGKTITLTATATDNVGIKKLQVFLDDYITPVAECTESPCTYDTSFSEEASHTYFAKAIDTADFRNVGRTENANFDVVDITAPSVSVSHSPDPTYPNQDVTFTSTATDDETGLDSIEIYLDDSLVKTCASSPCEYTTSFAEIGNHTYYALAMDKAAAGANIGKAPSLAPTGPNEFEVTDNTPPTVSVTSSLSTVKAGNDITLTATANDSESGIDTVEIFIDGSSVKSCTSSPCEYTTSYSGEATHTYYAEAKDKAANSARDPASGTYNFKVIPPWNIEYEGDADPRGKGWNFAGDDAQVTIAVSNGILTITNPANQLGYFYRSDFTGSKPATLEVLVKMESGRMPLYWIDGGGYVYSAELRPDRMIIGTDAGPKTVSVDLGSIFHTVRVVGNGSSIKVYVDGVLKSSDGASPNGGSKIVVFGETSSSFTNSKYNIDYLHFTDKGAFDLS